jgi:hypothetical protein
MAPVLSALLPAGCVVGAAYRTPALRTPATLSGAKPAGTARRTAVAMLGGGWDGAADTARPEIIEVKTGPPLAPNSVP